MITCSKRGPTIASFLGRWLLLHTSVRFGACICLIFSASAGSSTSAPGTLPTEFTGVALVLGVGCAGGAAPGLVLDGSLTGTGLSCVVLRICDVLERARREGRARDTARRLARLNGSILYVWRWCDVGEVVAGRSFG